MTDLQKSCEAIAASYLIVANTPLYLAARLKESSEVREFSRSNSPSILLAELSAALRIVPKSLQEESRPYLLLVALALHQDQITLAKAARLKPRKEYRWYSIISEFLLSRHVPTIRQVSKSVQFTSASSSSASTQVISE